MTDGSRVRISIVGVVVLALFSALLTRLWFLQVASGDTYAAAAQSNRVRLVQAEAPRGRILDAKGRVLVDNRVATAITIDRRIEPEEREESVERLAELLGTEPEEIQARIDDPRISPFAPVPVAIDVPMDVVVHVREHREDFPGVEAVPLTIRRYPNGALAAHVLGYVGELSDEELEEHEDDGYQRGDHIGKTGVERSFEQDLRGEPGLEKVEVDAQGRVLRTLGSQEPVPGDDVQLTLDLDVQRLAEESLAQAMEAVREVQDEEYELGWRTYEAPAGAVVVLDARDGSVVALTSSPTFAPEEFVYGIPTERWEWLNDPANDYPLTNRAVQGLYAPGSTWKLVTALAGLESDLISSGTTIDDTGRLRVADRWFRNAGGVAYGRINLPRALTVSSDVYFYTIGSQLWSRQYQGDPSGDAIQSTARTYGFGAPTGVALPGEPAGRVPDAAWKARVHEEMPEAFPYADWQPGDNVNLSVGQGDLLVTPLQLASAYAAFANGGSLYKPRLASIVLDVEGEVVREARPVSRGSTSLSPDDRTAIMAGLQGVVEDPKGTASAAFAGFPLDEVPVGGKTGTAEVFGKQDTSLFVAVTPPNAFPGQPQYVVLAVVEQAGRGSAVAAPIVRRILEGMQNPLVPLPPVQLGAQGSAD